LRCERAISPELSYPPSAEQVNAEPFEPLTAEQDNYHRRKPGDPYGGHLIGDRHPLAERRKAQPPVMSGYAKLFSDPLYKESMP
jgi:hypothetical protein